MYLTYRKSNETNKSELQLMLCHVCIKSEEQPKNSTVRPSTVKPLTPNA
jgi:hypothetical protein